jgi:hypothetical protein
MTTPRVTELQRTLEPTTVDGFDEAEPVPLLGSAETPPTASHRRRAERG